ncbi:hypothetical protein BT93_C1937 [Corymbia citriodora subsp. variegata]|nr:hypothetical protein BT93_C1937 [Corymbia citriodora subsp. variegata]
MANSEAEISSDVAPKPGGEYQVFLSFRGPDTRYGFTNFLYDHLVDAGVHVFRDDDELRIGEVIVIGENLLSAIDNSIIYIPIFSRTYAFSKWCLRELAHTVDVSKSKDEKNILPIFLDVEPDDVKLKMSIYKNALSEHERDFPNEVEVWKAALREVGQIKGWNVKAGQAAIVKSIVKEVLEKLKTKQKLVTEHLVGFDDRIKELTKLFNVDHDDVRLIVIYGMGGISKTTIAKFIFNRLCSHFGKCCSFLEGVREQSTKEGMVPLQKKLLSDIDGSISAVGFDNIEEGARRIGEILYNKKVLVVLDDVGETDHIKQLIGNSKLDLGSRIIITTRDMIFLEVEGFEGEILPYEILKMDDDPALQLSGQHAFRGDFPSDDYRRLSRDIVSTTGGLPLAIEVIGSLLKGKDQEIWEEKLEKLRRVPEKKILEKLRISYDDLENHHKQFFLDIACFFFNDNKTNSTYMWTVCQFYPKQGIKDLTNRCLLKMDNGKFWMHDQLIALGRQIVREDSLGDLGKQSRLWIVEEALEIIKTEEVNLPEEVGALVNLKHFSLSGCRKLRKLPGSLGNLTSLTKLDLLGTSIRELPNSIAELKSLCILHFTKYGYNNQKDHVWQLLSGISKLVNLEELDLQGHDEMRGEIPIGIGELSSLRILNLEHTGICRIPRTINMLHHLQTLELSDCHEIKELPELPTSLTCLHLESESLLSVPNLSNLTNLVELLLSNDKVLGEKSKPLSGCNLRWIGRLSALKRLELNLLNVPIPPDMASLCNLKELFLKHLNLETPGQLPSSLLLLYFESFSIKRAELLPSWLRSRNLSTLVLIDGEVEDIPLHGLPHLEELFVNRCKLLQRLFIPSELRKLRRARVFSCPELVEIQVGLLKSLESLWIDKCESLTRLDMASLCNLKELFLKHLNLETPGQLPSFLLRLHFESFSIRRAELLPSCLRLRNLSTLVLIDGEVEDIPLHGLSHLEKLFVNRCKLLQRLFIPSELRKLRRASVFSCP